MPRSFKGNVTNQMSRRSGNRQKVGVIGKPKREDRKLIENNIKMKETNEIEGNSEAKNEYGRKSTNR